MYQAQKPLKITKFYSSTKYNVRVFTKWTEQFPLYLFPHDRQLIYFSLDVAVINAWAIYKKNFEVDIRHHNYIFKMSDDFCLICCAKQISCGQCNQGKFFISKQNGKTIQYYKVL